MEFENPPIVELIAELRWLPPGVHMAADAGNVEVPPAFFAAGQPDSMYMTFGARVSPHGYTQFERLTPSGMPPIPFQPVHRFSKPQTQAGDTSIFQLGPGVFSAHATPPYKSWADFRPGLELGVASLIASRSEQERTQTFISATVRYIDGFTAEFLANATIPTFMAKTLGFDLAIPRAISALLEEGKEIVPQLRLNFPITGGFRMSLALADGNVRNQSALIMDSSISTGAQVAPDATEVMRALDAAHAVSTPAENCSFIAPENCTLLVG
jgi:uncharacterized protein (TIGR04255 family)